MLFAITVLTLLGVYEHRLRLVGVVLFTRYRGHLCFELEGHCVAVGQLLFI
jgi:hypothetical protein